MSAALRAAAFRLGARVGAALAGAVGVLALGFLPGLATPALAHGADAPDGTDYRTEVAQVTPAVPGLTVRAVEAGARLELTNRTGRTIEVLGYAGEPYLEIRPDGAYENLRSPATYLNRTLAGGTEPPATADPTLPPDWRRVATGPVVRWHDRRTHWMGATAPEEALADPDRPHRIRDWVVPLRDELAPVEVHGTLDWLPPPDPLPWWAASALGALAVGALGLLPVVARSGRAATVFLAAMVAGGGGAAVTFTALREIDAGASGLGGVLQGVLAGQLLPLLAGVAALAAGAYLLVRRVGGDFVLALVGACLALFAGAANGAVFARSVVPVPWSATSARLLIALVIVTGAGVCLAGILRLRAAVHVAGAGPAEPATGAAEPATGAAEPATGAAEPATGAAEPPVGRMEPGQGVDRSAASRAAATEGSKP